MNNKKIFIKNFYYNKTSIIKLIYLYNFLNHNKSFIDDLITKLQNFEFTELSSTLENSMLEFSNVERLSFSGAAQSLFLLKNNDQKIITILQIYQLLSPNYKKLELSFGYVYIYESKVFFYFKKDFCYEDFFKFFENFNNEFQINWLNLEFFDKEVKVLEIFKNVDLLIKPFLRSFRDEIIQVTKDNEFKKSKKIKIIDIDLNDKKFLFFLKNYEEKNIKIILNYAS